MDELLRRIADRLVAVTPLSGWTALYALVGTTVSVLGWRRLARWTGWAALPTLLSLLALSAVLALTLSPAPNYPRPLGLRSCLRGVPAELGGGPVAVLGHVEALLNLVLLAPLGLFLVLATRRPLLGVVVVVVLPAVVELTQTQVSGRMCSGADLVTNATGGLAGVAVGGLVLLAGARVRSRRP